MLSHSYQDFAEWYGNQLHVAYDLPSLDVVRKVWNRLPEIMRQRGRKTGPAYTKILPHEKRDWDVLEPNDVWIGDGHSFKAKVQHPVHGSPFKPEVTVVLDGCTRMVKPNSDKALRIESLQPHMANGLIKFRQEQHELIEQLRHFPDAEHDDGPDALHMLWMVATTGNRSNAAQVIYLPQLGDESWADGW